MLAKRIVLITASLLALAMAFTTLAAVIEIVTAGLAESPLHAPATNAEALARMSFDGPTFSWRSLATHGTLLLLSTAAFVATVLGHRDRRWLAPAAFLLLSFALLHVAEGILQFVLVAPHSAVIDAVLAALWTIPAAGCFWLARRERPAGGSRTGSASS